MGISAERQAELAEQIAVAATWVEGERKVLLEKLAAELAIEPAPEEVAVAVKKTTK